MQGTDGKNREWGEATVILRLCLGYWMDRPANQEQRRSREEYVFGKCYIEVLAEWENEANS